MKISNSNLTLVFAFTLPVVLLLLNDHYFKYAYPSFLTGKLSDVVGLAVWFVFLICLFPKYPKYIIISTISLFLFWKSPYSQPVLAFFLDNFKIKLHRTIDYSDLWALCVLIPAYKYRNEILGTFSNTKKSLKYIYSSIAIFAICATTLPRYVIFTNYEYKDTFWILPISKRTVFEKTRWPRQDQKAIDSLVLSKTFDVYVNDAYDNKGNKGGNIYNIKIDLDSVDNTQCKLTLNKLYDFDNGKEIKDFSKERFVTIFQTGFINPVNTKERVDIYANYKIFKK
jgi:hypothetical protein